MSGFTPTETQGQGPNWTHEDTTHLVVIWVEVEVQQQFSQGTRVNTHIYASMAWWMYKHEHQWSEQQCQIKAKAWEMQWIHAQDYNR